MQKNLTNRCDRGNNSSNLIIESGRLDENEASNQSVTFMRLIIVTIALAFPAFTQGPRPDQKNSPDATTRLLVDFFKGDTNRDGRISEREFGWPKVLFGSIDQNKDGYITANEVQSLLPSNKSAGSSGPRRYNPSAPGRGRQTMRLNQEQLASLPDITHFATHKSDRFLVDMEVISAGHPYFGKNFSRPHTGCHVYFKQPGKEATPKKPSSYAPVYAVADGIVTSVTPWFQLRPIYDSRLRKTTTNYRYGLGLTFARTEEHPVVFHYSIEPMIDPGDENFYRPFLKAKLGQRVKKGDVLGWMYTPPRPETDLRTHIHFNLMAKSQFMAPTMFTKGVTEAFHKRWGKMAQRYSEVLPACTGYKLSAEENPFGSGSKDLLY